MKKKYLLLIVPILLTGCTAKYTLTYEDNNFSEEVIISGVTEDEDPYFDRFKSDDAENNLKISESSDKSYKFSDEGTTKKLAYNYGNTLEVTKLLKYCYEDIIILNSDDYVTINTYGENYCKNYDVEIIFKTDKLVLDNNADKIDGNTYKWTDLSKDLILQVSKKESPSNSKSKKDNTVLRLIITLVVILVMIVLFIQRKSQAKKRNN